MTIMQYKGFLGSAEISQEDKILFGKLLHINGLITYEAETFPELESAFRESVDYYLNDCKERGIKPQKSCSGTFNIRTTSEKHQKLSFLATASNISLNSLMNEAVDLIIDKYSHELSKNLARTVFEFNWNHNESFRHQLTQWTFTSSQSSSSKTSIQELL
ncbi:TPA: type II toxin-antitoxin system HicB family antitoxin [Pasteurella multocida]|nr:type II toxin-antitoxin system HicB family antitoxin [Pasteurella multocida]